jgi:hypothetical protein
MPLRVAKGQGLRGFGQTEITVQASCRKDQLGLYILAPGGVARNCKCDGTGRKNVGPLLGFDRRGRRRVLTESSTADGIPCSRLLPFHLLRLAFWWRDLHTYQHHIVSRRLLEIIFRKRGTKKDAITPPKRLCHASALFASSFRLRR